MFLVGCVIAFAIFSADTPVIQGQKQESAKDEATVVQKGQTTDDERAYSKQYNDLYPDRDKNKLSERRKEIKDLGIMLGVIADTVDLPDLPPITSAEFLSNLTCSSDSIVIGSVKSKKAHLSEDETYVYTEYDFSVEDVLKNNSVSSIENNGNIKITRPGGVIKLDNRTITVSDERFEPLKPEKKYLLFLKYVPSAKGYMANISDSDFIVEGNSFKKFSEDMSSFDPIELRNGKSDDLLKNVRESILSDCIKNTDKKDGVSL